MISCCRKSAVNDNEDTYETIEKEERYLKMQKPSFEKIAKKLKVQSPWGEYG